MREPMSETLVRLPSAAVWIAITLLVAVLVISLLGSVIGLMVHAPELQSPHGRGLGHEALLSPYLGIFHNLLGGVLAGWLRPSLGPAPTPASSF
jgi:hypothetical protein